MVLGVSHGASVVVADLLEDAEVLVPVVVQIAETCDTAVQLVEKGLLDR